MAASASTGKAGFWSGFLLGLVTAAAGLLALALAYPPAPPTPPAIDPAAASGPEAPVAPPRAQSNSPSLVPAEPADD